MMKKNKRVAKAEKSSKMSKGLRGRAGRKKAIPKAKTRKDIRSRQNPGAVAGGRRSARKKQDDCLQHSKKRKIISPQVSRRRRLALVLFMLAAAGLVTYLLLGPIMRNMESRRNLAEMEEELEAERAKTTELQERMEMAQSEEYIEDEARGMNYVKPGEIPIVVLDDEEASGEETTFPALESESISPSSE